VLTDVIGIGLALWRLIRQRLRQDDGRLILRSAPFEPRNLSQGLEFVLGQRDKQAHGHPFLVAMLQPGRRMPLLKNHQ
jgi:hypothetical protein